MAAPICGVGHGIHFCTSFAGTRIIARVTDNSIGLPLPLALNFKRDFGIGRAAHLFHCLIEREPVSGLVVDMGDYVICFYPGFRPRCSIHHRYNFDQAILVRYLNPKTAELTGTKGTRNTKTHVVEPAIFGLPPRWAERRILCTFGDRNRREKHADRNL